MTTTPYTPVDALMALVDDFAKVYLAPGSAPMAILEARRAVEASASALAAMPAPTDLHAAIINLKAEASDKTIVQMGENPLLAYRLGHRDARHAAAELALNAPSPLAQQAGGVPAGWQPIESAPTEEELLGWREDCGVLLIMHTSFDRFASDLECEETDEETLFQKDWFGSGIPGGFERLEGSEVPTHWMPLPADPGAAPSPSAVQPLSEAQFPDVIVSAYTITEGFSGIKVERAQQVAGPAKWAVRKSGSVLGRSGAWEWEPMPSSRTDEWLAEYRFDTADDAIAAGRRAALGIVTKESST